MTNFFYHLNNSGISPETLSKKSGIQLNRLQSIMNDGREPSITEIEKLSKVLKLSPDFLIADSENYEPVSLLFRQNITNKKNIHKIDKASYIITNSLEFILDYEPVKELAYFPKTESTYLDARKLAGMFRNVFLDGDFYSPLVALPQILSEKLKCIITVTELGKGVDGASAFVKSIPFILISPRFPPRMLFTLAHEFAHILAHHGEEDFAILDFQSSNQKRKAFKNEVFANSFASELLLPEEGVATTLQKIRSRWKVSQNYVTDLEIIVLSHIYGVSFEVAAKRCEDLSLMPSGSSISLYESIKKDYGSAEKRAAFLNLPDRMSIEFPKTSPVLIDSIIKNISNGELSIGRASEILSISLSDVFNYNSVVE